MIERLGLSGWKNVYSGRSSYFELLLGFGSYYRVTKLKTFRSRIYSAYLGGIEVVYENGKTISFKGEKCDEKRYHVMDLCLSGNFSVNKIYI